MKSLIAVSFATVYGVSLRILFGFLNDFMGIMSVSFLILAPIIIGYLTIILTPKDDTQSLSGAFFKPWLTCLLILIITLFFNIEGTICWIMIYPLFSFLAGIGGIMAYFYRNYKSKKSEKTDNSLNVSIILFIPLIVGLVEGDKALYPKEFCISESVTISASTKRVWYHLTNINDITSKESKNSFSNLMGFPKHIRTILDTPSLGGKRTAIYEKGLYFEETISKIENEKLLELSIKTDPKKIPPTVMDEHIIIGGKHVDILQDNYQLEKLSDSSCRLTLSSRFYINTPFNWYASIWASYLMSDILKSEINLIKERAINQ
jgi:hypothetical protein